MSAAGPEVPSLLPVGRDGVDEIVLTAGHDRAVGEHGGRGRDVPAGDEMPAQCAVGVDGVDAVAAGVDDAVRPHGRPGVDVAAAGLGADTDPLRTGAHLHDPARLHGGSGQRVKVVVVGADIDRPVVCDGGRAEDDVTRRVRPAERSVARDVVQLAVLRSDQDGAVARHRRRRDDGAAGRERPPDDRLDRREHERRPPPVGRPEPEHRLRRLDRVLRQRHRRSPQPGRGDGRARGVTRPDAPARVAQPIELAVLVGRAGRGLDVGAPRGPEATPRAATIVKVTRRPACVGPVKAEPGARGARSARGAGRDAPGDGLGIRMAQG